MQHLGTDTGSLSPCWGKNKHTMSVHVPLMTGTMPSKNPGIFASEGNPASYVQANGNGNMSLVLIG